MITATGPRSLLPGSHLVNPSDTMPASDINMLGAGLLAAVHQAPAELTTGDQAAIGTFVSPVSVSLALVLLLNGATEGSTVHK